MLYRFLPIVSSFIDYFDLLIKIYKYSEVRQFCHRLPALDCSSIWRFFVRLLTLEWVTSSKAKTSDWRILSEPRRFRRPRRCRKRRGLSQAGFVMLFSHVPIIQCHLWLWRMITFSSDHYLIHLHLSVQSSPVVVDVISGVVISYLYKIKHDKDSNN